MSHSIDVDSAKTKTGERTFGYLDVSVLADESPLRIGVHVLAGKKDGPTLLLLATQHGDEVGPLAVLRDVIADIDLNGLAGNVIVVPVANPIAFQHGHRSSWLDGLYGGTTGNLNRLWPGKPNGFITERMAYAISQNILAHADCVIDYHASPADGLAIYYAYYMPEDGEVGRVSRQLALQFGMEILMRRPGRHSGAGDTLSDYIFRELGKPVVPVELGHFHGLRVGEDADAGEQRRDLLEVGVTGTFNVLKHLGMLSGRPERPRRQVIVSPETRCMPAKGGVLLPEVEIRDIGRRFSRGAVLGRVVGPMSFDLLDEITTP